MAMSQSQTPTLTQTQLPHGYRFNPDDEELVRFFLYPKFANPHFTTFAPVRECSLYAYHPLQIWNTFHRINGDDVFFFTNLKRKIPNSIVVRKIAGGPATWHREDKDHQICVQIDKNYSVTALKKGFSYLNTQPHQPGCSWMMYEHSLPSLSQVTVMRQLRRNDDDNTHQSTQETERSKRANADAVDDAENTISQMARVNQHSQYQYNKDFDTEAETVSAEVVNGVRFKNLFLVKLCRTSTVMRWLSIPLHPLLALLHQTVSTLNPAENLQPFEVACNIDNDGEVVATGDDDLYPEVRELLNSTGCSDEADVVPAIEAALIRLMEF